MTARRSVLHTKRIFVLTAIRDAQPAANQNLLIATLGCAFFEASPVHGAQHLASQIIANLRRDGLIEDVADRCPTCRGARTRGQHNVPLVITQRGIDYLTAATR